LTVRAKDRGSPSLSSEAYLAVEVVDVNENLYAPRFEDFVTEDSVRENALPGTLVAEIQNLAKIKNFPEHSSGKFSKPEVRLRKKQNMNFTKNLTRITNMWFFCESNEYLLKY
jgi:hypothetical protein